MTEIEVVTIPRAEYDNLLQCRLKLATILLGQQPLARRPTSRIFRDVEIAAFVDGCLARRITYAAIRAECAAKFGPDRAPSETMIGRYARNRRDP